MNLLIAINRLRLFLLYNFFSGYIRKKARERRGICKKCGLCCGNCFLLCPDGTCSTHNDRPRWCHKDFPIDEFDQKVSGVFGKCGYYWDLK